MTQTLTETLTLTLTLTRTRTLTVTLTPTLPRLNPGVGRDAMQLGVGVGDQVIQLTNDYENLVFNGDIGRVTAVRPGR